MKKKSKLKNYVQFSIKLLFNIIDWNIISPLYYIKMHNIWKTVFEKIFVEVEFLFIFVEFFFYFLYSFFKESFLSFDL